MKLALVLFLGIAVAAIVSTIAVGKLDTTSAATTNAQMTLNVPAGGVCDVPAAPTTCSVPLSSTFTLAVDATAPTAGYIGMQTFVVYNGLTYNPTTLAGDEITWPDSGLPVRSQGVTDVAHGDLTAIVPPFPTSSFSGTLVSISISCTPGVSTQQIELITLGSPPAGVLGASFKDPATVDIPAKLTNSPLTIQCEGTTPTATPFPTGLPTPTPPATPCTVNAQPDSDCDGMPDPFESANACTDVNTPDATADPDQDGKANILEYATGTDPCSGDTDGDGVGDKNDSCATLAEDYDGFEDGDGCPEYDNDKDGICDAHFAPGPPGPVACTNPSLPGPRYVPAYPGGPAPDRCPNLLEDVDGFKDLDGCPDADNDDDGFPDAADACPGTDYTAGPDGIADTGDEPLSELLVPLQTKEDYDGILDEDGCHDSPGDDYDEDGLTDEDEFYIFGTNPADPDTDGDGCWDGTELGTDEAFGGRRDPLREWDFYDLNGDGIIDLFSDLFGVALAFGQVPGDPLYATDKDRIAPPTLANEPDPTKREPWDLGPPDGIIDLFNDVFGVAFQFGHDCRQPAV